MSDFDSPKEWARKNREEMANVTHGKQDELPPPTVLSTDPAVYLARRFDSKWGRMSARHTEYRSIRASHRGHATGYIRRMLADNGLSPEHIEAYMDAFMEAVGDGSVVVDTNQNGFSRFTGWWGSIEIDDPVMQADSDSYRDAVLDTYRRGLTNG